MSTGLRLVRLNNVLEIDTDAAMRWATNSRYPSRVHMTNGRGPVSLCGFPVHSPTRQRPDGLGICPDCEDGLRRS